MKGSKVTIYDVASHAGVAISTVSRVLNDSPEVSDSTREKVLLAIEALKFKPDRTAKSLAGQSSGWLAVAVPSSTSPFYNEILKGIKDSLRAHESDMLLCNLGSSNPRETLIRFLDRGAVDALLLISLSVDDELASELKSLQAPVVLIGSESNEFDCIYWAESKGAKDATTHLIESGRKKIGMITASKGAEKSYTRVSSLREEGYRAALKDAGLKVDEALIASGNSEKHAGYSEEAGAEAMRNLLKTNPDIDAVFCASDVQAIGALSSLREENILVPDQIAVVGYDDIKVSKYLGLSSVDQDLLNTGFRATEFILKKRKRTEGEVIHEVVEPTLQIRRSSQ